MEVEQAKKQLGKLKQEIEERGVELGHLDVSTEAKLEELENMQREMEEVYPFLFLYISNFRSIIYMN